MSRSIKKGPYAEERLMSRILAMNEAGEKKVVKTWSRATTIFPQMVGHTIAVYDGKKARSRVRYRRYGRLQARRIRSHQNVQGACGKNRQEVRS